jgi:glutamyl-Q tRNA(Asp) synthetase
LQARTCGGRWLLRIEDIDPPREQPGAAAVIVEALDSYGFEWDGDVIYQSQSAARHRAAAAQLIDAGLAYHCGCSRQDLAGVRQGPLGPIYPGTCRAGSKSKRTSIRVRTNNEPIAFHDLLQGPQSQRLEGESGDFVITRRDGLVAYHLAVVVDDFDQGVTQVVRGTDLLDSTQRHIHLQRLLGYHTPEYVHIPVALNSAGQKLSKTTGAGPIPRGRPGPVLFAALRALRQSPPDALCVAGVTDIWQWAMEHWTLDTLSQQRSIPQPANPMAESGNPLS